jgi:hypothetical protein
MTDSLKGLVYPEEIGNIESLLSKNACEKTTQPRFALREVLKSTSLIYVRLALKLNASHRGMK